MVLLWCYAMRFTGSEWSFLQRFKEAGLFLNSTGSLTKLDFITDPVFHIFHDSKDSLHLLARG